MFRTICAARARALHRRLHRRVAFTRRQPDLPSGPVRLRPGRGVSGLARLQRCTRPSTSTPPTAPTCEDNGDVIPSSHSYNIGVRRRHPATWTMPQENHYELAVGNRGHAPRSASGTSGTPRLGRGRGPTSTSCSSRGTSFTGAIDHGASATSGRAMDMSEVLTRDHWVTLKPGPARQAAHLGGNPGHVLPRERRQAARALVRGRSARPRRPRSSTATSGRTATRRSPTTSR